MPYELPRFNAAQRYVRMLLGVGALLAISGAVLLILTLRQVNISWLGGARTARAFGYLGVSLWTAAAVVLAADALSGATGGSGVISVCCPKWMLIASISRTVSGRKSCNRARPSGTPSASSAKLA